MRVLHIFNEIKFSGAEIMYANAAPLFNNKNIKMLAFATGQELGSYEPQFVQKGIQVWFRPMPNRFQLVSVVKYVRQSIDFIKQNHVDLIHVHRSDAKWLFGLIAKLSGVKCIYTVHNVFKHRKFTWLKGYLERYTARKWFGLQSQTIGRSVYENERVYYKNPSVCINNWYDDERFFPKKSQEEKEELRRQFNIPLDHFVVISTGGCSEVKNHHDILRAIAILPDKRKVTYLHLGCGKTEEEEKELSKELDIVENVIFLGNRNNVRDYLIISDAYVMPSKFEGLSIASIEAMACGIVSILYDSPGLRDLITGNNNGLLIDRKVQDLADGVEWIMKHRQEAEIKAEKAVAFVNREFSMEENVKQIIGLYLKQLR